MQNAGDANRRLRRNRVRTRTAVAFALALLAHIVFLAFVALWSLAGSGAGARPRVHTQPIALRPLTEQQWRKNRGANAPKESGGKAEPPKPLAEKEPEKKRPEPIPKGQVVDVSPGNREEDPNANYLAESSNRVKKETRSKNQTAFYRNAMPKPSSNRSQEGGGQDSVEKPAIAGNNGLGFDERPLKDPSKQKGALEVPNSRRRDELALKLEKNGLGTGPRIGNRSESENIVGNSTRLHVQPGEINPNNDPSPGARGSPGVATLLPSPSVMDKIAGAPANDHLGDLEDGEGTYLNTKEWKYSTFFNRLKQSVGMHWDPNTPIRQRDPTGSIYGGRDRYTILTVTLNETGAIKDIFVAKSSGLDFLDLEAVHSFERAQPFPNPPPGLVSADSTVRFNFGFFLEMGGSPRLRLFRQGN